MTDAVSEVSCTFDWSPLCVEDVQTLHGAQSQLLADHEEMAEHHFTADQQEWKKVMGYPESDDARLDFIKCMATMSTKFGERLHCLKLTRHRGEESATAGFIEFEVKMIDDPHYGEVRKIHVRNIIVASKMRRQGCGTKLYESMLEYLGPNRLDKIQLCVVDFNKAATSLYFKLGFRVTQWCVHVLGSCSSQRAILLRLQHLRGSVLEMAKPAPVLKKMPHMFQDQVVGETVELFSEDSQCRACIDAYDAESKTFSLRHLHTQTASCSGPCEINKVCVNGLFARGQLRFERAVIKCLMKESTPAQPHEYVAPVPVAQYDVSLPACPLLSISRNLDASDETKDWQTLDSPASPSSAMSSDSPPRGVPAGKRMPRDAAGKLNVPTLAEDRKPAPAATVVSHSIPKRSLEALPSTPEESNCRPTKRSRGICAGSGFLRRETIKVYEGGSILLGLLVDELGFIVREVDPSSQPALQKNDVIVAVAGNSLIKNPWNDDPEAYKEDTRSMMKQCLAKNNGTLQVVVGSWEILHHQSLDWARLELELLFTREAFAGAVAN